MKSASGPKSLSLICFVFLLSFLHISAANSQQPVLLSVASEAVTIPQSIRYPDLVGKFYALNNQQVFWLKTDNESAGKRLAMLATFDSSAHMGLDKAKYAQAATALQYSATDIAGFSAQQLLKADMLITGAAIAFCKDLYHGADMKRWISYDELSARYITDDNDLLVKGLHEMNDTEQWLAFIHSMEPGGADYSIIKRELAVQLGQDSGMRVKQLSSTLNYLRWLYHLHLHEFILVNIGSATVRHYRGDTLNLSMKAVVGTPDTRTPRFAAYCTEVILYPYWNVPRSIAINELLPRFKKSHKQMSFMNMELLDQKGRIVNPDKIAWKSLSKSNFPYRFREKTGCINPLGVVKFNITDPYSVYLHDTNFKSAFLAKSRYLSHGCIRVEAPVALANALLPAPLDHTFLEACYKELEPVVLKLQQPVPVLTVYMTAEVDEQGKVQYFRDYYGLLK